MAATDLIRVAGERLFGVHVNDWRTPRAFGDRYVIGDGIINLPPLLSAVRSTGYKGAFTLEIFSEEWLFDSLWKGDLDDVILRSRAGLMKAWEASLCEN
jgi:sugar phosphate isomerase/epimerase